LLPEVGDSKEHPLRVGLITENYIYHFGDLPCFIRGAVHIEHRYGARDVLGANTLRTDKVFVYVAPEFKSTLTECTSLVSVVLISIGRMIDVPQASRVLVESCLGSLFSHFDL